MNNMSCIAMQLQLKNLEQDYGTTLFERGGRGHHSRKTTTCSSYFFSNTTCSHVTRGVSFFYTFLLFLLQNHALFKLLFLENHHMLPWSLFTKLPTKLMEYIM